MVFIGDFVPNIIALIFPENWAQDTRATWPRGLQLLCGAVCCKARANAGPTRTCSILIAAVLGSSSTNPRTSYTEMKAAGSITCCEVLLVPMMLPNDLSKLKFLQPVSIMSLL